MAAENNRPLRLDRVEAIDWQAPWLLPYRSQGLRIAANMAHGMPSVEALNAARLPLTPPLRFVPQSELAPGGAYESYIYDSGCCPTREGLHDFFNGLVWLHFPLTKRCLNHLHVKHIALTGNQPLRGPARDRLTVFDENAAFLQCPDVLWEALAAKDWPRLLGELRPLWREAHLVLFGHALLEKLVYPRKPMTAHVYRVRGATHLLADLDACVAADLHAAGLTHKPFAHLPVLGVPGWWPHNEDPVFYADATVFRPARTKLSHGTDLA